MIANREHLEFDLLNDYVDDRLDVGARSRVVEHLASCEYCRESFERLTDLLDRAENMMDSVLPPEDLWQDVRAAIDQRKEAVLPVPALSNPAAPAVTVKSESGRPWWARRALLAAAAVLLMVGSSAVTAIVLQSAPGGVKRLAEARVSGSDAPGQTPVLPANFRQTEGEYLRSIDELRSTLQAQRSTLRPETVAAVEHSLAIVDAAIDEARAALLSDPSNRTLVDLLTASYERKLDLLRRAADLGART